jgi:hypothetical protein
MLQHWGNQKEQKKSCYVASKGIGAASVLGPDSETYVSMLILENGANYKYKIICR